MKGESKMATNKKYIVAGIAAWLALTILACDGPATPTPIIAEREARTIWQTNQNP